MELITVIIGFVLGAAAIAAMWAVDKFSYHKDKDQFLAEELEELKDVVNHAVSEHSELENSYIVPIERHSELENAIAEYIEERYKEKYVGPNKNFRIRKVHINPDGWSVEVREFDD